MQFQWGHPNVGARYTWGRKNLWF